MANKYLYVEGNDVFKLVSTIDGETTESYLTRFEWHPGQLFNDDINIYFKKQLRLVCDVLKSKGIILNVHTVPTVDDIGPGENGYFTAADIENSLPHNKVLHDSIDGYTYYLIQDKERGRGWAVLCKLNRETNLYAIEIISQGHRDELLNGEFIRSFGIDYKLEHDPDLE